MRHLIINYTVCDSDFNFDFQGSIFVAFVLHFAGSVFISVLFCDDASMSPLRKHTYIILIKTHF